MNENEAYSSILPWVVLLPLIGVLLGADAGDLASLEDRYHFAARLTAERLAMNHSGVDITSTRQEIEEQYGMYNHREVPGYRVVPPGIDGYVPFVPEYADWTQEERNHEARRLLEQAGYSEENPLRVEIRYNTSGSDWANAWNRFQAGRLCSQLRNPAGIVYDLFLPIRRQTNHHLHKCHKQSPANIQTAAGEELTRP